jgi:hypothetical protein
MHIPRAPRGPVIERRRIEAMYAVHNRRTHSGRHTTSEPFPTWFKVFFAVTVGGPVLLIAVAVAVLTVIWSS